MSYVVSEPSAPPEVPSGGSLDTLRRHIGAAGRAARATALDAWLATMFPGHLPGVSLVAVGGLGRRDCAPHSDLDLVLLHNGTAGIDRIASALWYPIWDARLGLDHSVRTLPEALSVAHDDVKVALGLLDARHVAGDEGLSAELIAAASDQWRRTAVRLLPQLKELTATRWATHGELAFLLEGDLKRGRRRPARPDHPARHRPGWRRRHDAPRRPRREPAAARHPRRVAPRRRPPGRPARRAGARGGRRPARRGRRPVQPPRHNP
nr:hypothetical protein GCM10020092_017640 [Actinoplanes digitatis]